MLKNLLIGILVLFPPCLYAEVCKTKTYTITIQDNADDFDETSNKVKYHSVNNKTGKSIDLRGNKIYSHSPDGTPASYQGYLFKNHGIDYAVGNHGDGCVLYVKKFSVTAGLISEKVLVSEEGIWEE
jgi:hypothetical protein